MPIYREDAMMRADLPQRISPMTDATTSNLTEAEIEARRAAVAASIAPQPQPEPAAEPAPAKAPRKPAKAGDGTVTVRARKVLPAKNPLKDLEAKVKPAAAPKPAAKPAAKPARAKSGEVKFADAFARTFHQLLDDHGFKQAESPKPELVVFAKNSTRVEITNPSVPGGSKIAAFTVTRKSGKAVEGEGRDALADALGIARLVR
jgi:hypothetical protein